MTPKLNISFEPFKNKFNGNHSNRRQPADPAFRNARLHRPGCSRGSSATRAATIDNPRAAGFKAGPAEPDLLAEGVAAGMACMLEPDAPAMVYVQSREKTAC